MRTHGYTLIELLFVLLILGGLLGIAMPPAGRWLDDAAVHAARDELAGALAWTRMAAASAGGATLVLDPATARFEILGPAGARGPATDLARRYRVEVDVGTDQPVLLRYDALGIGRIASRTIRIRRHAAEAGLTVSAYGRVRRW
ncbi:MAG: prepilin-type N-terminal cleavage/methylation domain-containing protein [Gemmatimonadota bacterium]